MHTYKPRNIRKAWAHYLKRGPVTIEIRDARNVWQGFVKSRATTPPPDVYAWFSSGRVPQYPGFYRWTSGIHFWRNV